MAAATTGIVDEDSLMAAIEEAIANHETDITINLNSGFTVFKPIALNNVESFTLNLTGNTLTCNGDVFNVSGETTITIIGSGSIRAGGNLVTSTGTGRIVVTQIGGDITVRQLFSRATNWVYDLISGTLSLSQTVEMGANTVLEAEKNTTISSTASDSAVHLANPSAAFNLAGSLSATGTGVAMDASTQLNVEDSAKLTAGGNAIAAGTDCKITIGARSSVTAGKRVLALGDAGSGSGSVATGTSVKSGGNVALSDGTIAPYLENGAVVTFDSTKAAGNRFATVAVANPEAQSWYGSIDDVWCLTKADYDALYALLGKGSAVDPGGEEVVGPGADPVFPPATAGDGIGSGAEGAASADSTGGAVSVSGSGSLWNATRASTGAIGTPLAVTGDDNAATAGALALGVEAALAALLISRTNLFLATNARFRRLRRSPRRPGRRSLLRGHDVP